jgi:hypothetical protein
VIRSQIVITSFMSCSISQMPISNASRMKRISAISSFFSCGFMPAAGSSRRRIFGGRRQGAGDFQAALVAVGERRGDQVGLVVQVEGAQQLDPARGERAALAHEPRAAQHVARGRVPRAVEADDHVVEHREVLKQPDVLERARDAPRG